MIEIDKVKYLFVIDTDTYSGNFEREMCAYITGQFGDCGVGEDEADVFDKEVGETMSSMFDLVVQQADEHGCMRPATIWPTPGWWNDGMGKHYRDGKGPKKKAKYPAYQSVGIWMSEKPSKKDIEFMKKRAKAFLKYNIGEFKKSGMPKKIIGFRLVTVKTEESSEDL